MACPTCDHTMHNVGKTGSGSSFLFWCPRCGTLKGTGVPMLVKRCIDFGGYLSGTEHAELIDQYRVLGIEESIGGGHL